MCVYGRGILDSVSLKEQALSLGGKRRKRGPVLMNTNCEMCGAGAVPTVMPTISFKSYCVRISNARGGECTIYIVLPIKVVGVHHTTPQGPICAHVSTYSLYHFRRGNIAIQSGWGVYK